MAQCCQAVTAKKQPLPTGTAAFGFSYAVPANGSVGHAPIDHGLGGLAAAGADIAQVLLREGHAAAGQTCFFLHLHLAGQVAAPHGLDIAGVGLGQLLDLVHGGGCPGALFAVGHLSIKSQ